MGTMNYNLYISCDNFCKKEKNFVCDFSINCLISESLTAKLEIQKTTIKNSLYIENRTAVLTFNRKTNLNNDLISLWKFKIEGDNHSKIHFSI